MNKKAVLQSETMWAMVDVSEKGIEAAGISWSGKK